MNFKDSRKAISDALDAAEKLGQIPNISLATLVVNNLNPQIVIGCSHALKVRLYRANANKPNVHLEYEPFEGKNIKIVLVGERTSEFSREAAKNGN